MARVNLEQSVWSDPRFKALARLLNVSPFDAIGRMAAVWAYCTEKRSYVVSREILTVISECDDFADFLKKCDLGEDCNEGIRIRGTRGRIEWLSKLRKNGAKGGRPKQTRTKPDHNQKVNQTVTRIEPESNPLTLTLTLAPVPALTQKQEIQNLPAGSKRATPGAENSSSGQVWVSYSEAYRAKYGQDPVRNAVVNSQIKQFIARVPIEEAPEIARFYVSHRDSFYVKAMHPVGLLLKDAEKLRTEWASGRQMTTTQARMVEKGSHHEDQLRRIQEGKL